MLDNIWAKKPKETLAEHTGLCCQQFISLKRTIF